MLKYTIYIIAFMAVILFGRGNSSSIGPAVISEKFGNIEKANSTVSIDKTNSIVSFGKENSLETDYIYTDDSEFEDAAKSAVKISEGQQIEKAEWIEKGIVFRIAIEQSEDRQGEYRHLKDYIFVKTDGIKWFEVDYASKKDSFDADRYVGAACDFDVVYEDVTFDGKKDVLISLGYFGASSKKYCAFVDKGNEFIYVKSFENIMFDHIDNDSKCIVGFESDSYTRKIGTRYEFYDDEFVLTEETIYEYDESKGGFGVKEIKKYKSIEERRSNE